MFLDRNRFRYPKGPRDWRNIKDAVSFHRKKRENLLALATDYPETCTVMTHVGRLVLLNDPTLINEIFIGRADLVSNKVDGYLENQLRYKEGKHIRTGKTIEIITNEFYLLSFRYCLSSSRSQCSNTS
jgi:hypothetical protein